MFALQLNNGRVVELYERRTDAIKAQSYISAPTEVVDTSNASHIEVHYAELGGGWGYGHSEVSFETYSPLVKGICALYNWMKSTARVFGPDWRDVRDYFSNCRLSINGKDYTDWLLKQNDSIHKDMMFI